MYLISGGIDDNYKATVQWFWTMDEILSLPSRISKKFIENVTNPSEVFLDITNRGRELDLATVLKVCQVRSTTYK